MFQIQVRTHMRHLIPDTFYSHVYYKYVPISVSHQKMFGSTFRLKTLFYALICDDRESIIK